MRSLRVVVLAVLACGGVPLSQATAPVAVASQRLTLLCAVFYTPARSIWQREVVIEHDARQVLALRIDGQSPYTFAAHGPTLLTALDNERIQIDWAQGLWRSDFRGLAAGQGSCERKR